MRTNTAAKRPHLAIAMTILLSTSSATAAEFQELCFSTVRWANDAVLLVDQESFPEENAFRNDLMNALGRWNSVRGMYFEFNPILDDTNPGFELGDGLSEVTFATNEEIGGLFGGTAKRVFCGLFGARIQEADILFNSEAVPWANGAHDPRVDEGDPNVMSTNFRHTAVHEMGHFLGLQHEDSAMATMLSTDTAFWGGGPSLRAHPFPDDVFGARILYPHPNEEVDVAISNFRWVGENDVRLILASGLTQTGIGGSMITAGFGAGNVGNQVATFSVSIMLSTNATISASDIPLDFRTVTLPPGIFADFEFQVRLPAGIMAGDYFMGGILDAENAIDERREGNNTITFPGMVRVLHTVAPECQVDSDCPEAGQICLNNLCAFQLEPEE